MKRFNAWPYYDIVQTEEDPDGEWVLADEAAKLEAVVAALPKCDCEQCPGTATHTRNFVYFCDRHAPTDAVQLPYAEALRELHK